MLGFKLIHVIKSGPPNLSKLQTLLYVISGLTGQVMLFSLQIKALYMSKK